MSEQNQYDLRSYFPKFERVIIWDDGSEYRVRDIRDLSNAEFNAMAADEQGFSTMTAEQIREALERHVAMLVVVPSTPSITTAKGMLCLTVEGSVDLSPGDKVFVNSGLYVERNEVESVDEKTRNVVVKRPWRFNADAGRLFRSVSVAEVHRLAEDSPRMFNEVLKIVKAAVTEEDGGERPQTAASGSTS